MIPMKTLTINGKTYCLEDTDSVSFDTSQTLSAEQQAQARKNIGAAEASSCSIVCTALGQTIALADASDCHLCGLKLYGKTVQNGTAAAEAPIEMVSAGASGSIETKIIGANLIPYPYSEKSGTYYGVSYDVQADGRIFFSGIPTRGFAFNIAYPLVLPKGTYTFSYKGTLSASATLRVYSNSTTYAALSVTTKSATFTIEDTTSVQVYILINATTDEISGNIYPMLNIGTTALTYEPYKTPQNLITSTPNGLPGVPVKTGGNYTDDNGQQWSADYKDFASGEAVQNTKIVTLDGTESVGGLFEVNGLTVFRVPNGDAKPPAYVWGNKEGLFSHGIYFAAVSAPTEVSAFSVNDYVQIALPTEVVGTTVDEVKVYLKKQYDAGTPLTVLFRLIEPIRTNISEAEMSAFAALATNKPNTTIINDAEAYMEVEYVADTKTYIDNKFTELQNAILATGTNV